MLKNILTVQENWPWEKESIKFFIQGNLFQNLCNNYVKDQQI